jgi:hypothetical protein
MNVTSAKKSNVKAQSQSLASSDRLDSWKQIAVYLDRAVRTVQRWEKREALPVRRHIHVKAGTVYTFKKEIDAWLADRGQLSTGSRAIHRRPQKPGNAMSPLQEARLLFAAFRLCLAIVAQGTSQDCDDGPVPDSGLLAGESDPFSRRPQASDTAPRGQQATHD